MNNLRKHDILKLTLTAMFVALIVIMAFTPIGYLHIGPVSITFMVVPVVLGACLCGTVSGAVLGLAFGLTSFFQCFGMDPLGVYLLGQNAFLTFMMCVLPRVLIGVFASLVYKLISRGIRPSGEDVGYERSDNTRPGSTREIISYTVSGIVGSITNTVFFVGMLVLCFYTTGALAGYADGALNVGLGELLIMLITSNSLIELCVNAVLVTLICTALRPLLRRIEANF